jgi:imidazolonepropionase-like amidohydrolase
MRTTLLLLAVLSTGCAHVAPPAASAGSGGNDEAVQKRTVVLVGHTAGSETVTIHGSERVIDYEYTDRGRGPRTHTVLTTGSDGLTRTLRTGGHDTFMTPIDERLTPAAGKLAWSNGAESDSAPETLHAFYVSMYGPPEESAVLTRALLASPQHRLPLLPAGEATIRKAGELTVRLGDRSQHITCYEIGGLGFTPSPIWLDDHNDLFASASSWSSVVVAGWESALTQLVEAQDGWREAGVKAASARLAHRPATGVAITGARLFDPVTLQTTPTTTIVIRGNRIEAVGPDGSVVIPEGFERIDATGKTIIPGLWDMHTHVSTEDGILHLANGVTSIRDLGNDIDALLDTRKKFDSGEAIGPRIVMAGIIDGPGKFAGPTKMLVDNEAEARAAVEKYASLGFEQIKIYSSVRPELVPVITRRAHELGLRVSGHVPAFMRAEEAVRAGYDELQHANFLFLNFFSDVKDTRGPVRFTSVAERAATLDLQSPEVRDFVSLLRNRPCDAKWDAAATQAIYRCKPGIVVDPTLSIFEDFFTDRKGTMAAGYAAVADRLPPQVRRGYLTGGLPFPEGMEQRYRDSFGRMLALVKMLHDAGVPIVAGTDALAGFALHRELELYVQAGIPAPEVLRIATLGAAVVVKHDQQLGSVTPGKLADLVLIDGDPSRDIHDIRKITKVIKDGTVYDARELDAEIGVH